MRALIASSDAAITKRIQRMLQDRGWQCECAPTSNADELEAVLRRGDFEMVVVVLTANPSKANVEKLRDHIGGKMVVVGPADPKIILGVLHHCGAEEYVNVDDLEPEFESVLRRSQRVKRGKVIAVMSPSGGGGSTTLAVNLATVLAGKAARCGLIDLNLSAGDAAAMLDMKPDHSIADFARNTHRIDLSLFSQLLSSHSSGIELLAAPLDFDDIPDVTNEAVRTAITMARDQFPYVVVDLDQSCSSEQIEALKLADVILLVFQLDFISLRNVRRVVDYFTRCGVAKTLIRLVVNRYGQTAEISPSQVETALKMKIDFYLPEDPKDINRAENTGVPVVVDRPRTKISRSINELAAEVNGVT